MYILNLPTEHQSSSAVTLCKQQLLRGFCISVLVLTAGTALQWWNTLPTKQLRWQWGHCRAGWEQKAHGCVSTMPEKVFQRDLLCKWLLKEFSVCSQHIREIFGKIFAPALSFAPSAAQIKWFPCNQKSAVYATQPKSSCMKSWRNFSYTFHPSGRELVQPSSKTLHSHSLNIIRLLLGFLSNLSRLSNC